jgi:hypothetical protein
LKDCRDIDKIDIDELVVALNKQGRSFEGKIDESVWNKALRGQDEKLEIDSDPIVEEDPT